MKRKRGADAPSSSLQPIIISDSESDDPAPEPSNASLPSWNEPVDLASKIGHDSSQPQQHGNKDVSSEPNGPEPKPNHIGFPQRLQAEPEEEHEKSEHEILMDEYERRYHTRPAINLSTDEMRREILRDEYKRKYHTGPANNLSNDEMRREIDLTVDYERRYPTRPANNLPNYNWDTAGLCAPGAPTLSPNVMSLDDDVPPYQDPAPTLCKEQQDLVDLIASGRNVFYTGSAGCGKSTVLQAAVKRLQQKGLQVDIVAPTGRAALQVKGTSTWSYMGWTPDHHKVPLDELKHKGFRKHVLKRLKETQVLIIDEISMVENHHLERMNASMKAARWFRDQANAPPFGGVQLIVTGDFCQLPPVKPFQHCITCGLEMTPNDTETEYNCPKNHGPFPETDKWAFKSNAWEEANFAYVHLKEIHRQSDKYFIKMLQKCRLGIQFAPDELRTLMDHPCQVQKATRLLCTRREVADVNRENFMKLKTPMYQYKALDDFNWNKKAHPQFFHYNNRMDDGTLVACKDQRSEPSVTLRGGMLVVLQVNLDLAAGLCNGSQGIVCGFEDFDPEKLPRAKKNHLWGTIGGEHAKLRERQVDNFMKAQRVRSWPRVLFHNGQKRTIYAWCTVNSVGDKEPYSLLHRTQIPLVAGWAMSVHKSQGMTLDRVIVNLARVFEEGQVYVALSRATSLEGLKIEGGSEGLSLGYIGNNEVQSFLKDKFGEGLLLDES